MDTIKYLMELFPKPPVHTEQEQREKEASIVSIFATGNISLQTGRYLTEADIDKKRKEIISHHF